MDAKEEGIRIAKEWRKLCFPGVPDPSLEVLAGYIAYAIEAEATRWRDVVVTARKARDEADAEVERLCGLAENES